MDNVTTLKHWQIKEFPEDTRLAVTRAAAGAGKTVTQWLEPIIAAALNGEGLPTPVNHGNGTLSPLELATIAGNAALPQWLRSAYARRLGSLIGAAPPPAPVRRKAIAAPDTTPEQPPAREA